MKQNQKQNSKKLIKLSCWKSSQISVKDFATRERFCATTKNIIGEKKSSSDDALKCFDDFVIKIKRNKKAGVVSPAFEKKHLGGYP